MIEVVVVAVFLVWLVVTLWVLSWRCPCCGRVSFTIKNRRMSCRYVEEERNWLYSCNDCYEEEQSHWREMWDDYYSCVL